MLHSLTSERGFLATESLRRMRTAQLVPRLQSPEIAKRAQTLIDQHILRDFFGRYHMFEAKRSSKGDHSWKVSIGANASYQLHLLCLDSRASSCISSSRFFANLVEKPTKTMIFRDYVLELQNPWPMSPTRSTLARP